VKRITGFTSHWMTLSGQEMIVLMLLGALLFFAASGWLARWLAAAGVVIAIAFVAAYTRSMWMGAALGGGYLVWQRNRWWLLVAPVPVALLLWAEPDGRGRPYRVGLQAGGRSGFQPVPRGLPARRVGDDQRRTRGSDWVRSR
jgi:hypothetical protein